MSCVSVFDLDAEETFVGFDAPYADVWSSAAALWGFLQMLPRRIAAGKVGGEIDAFREQRVGGGECQAGAPSG